MMMIVKLFEGRSTTPKFFVFKRVDEVKKRFLVDFPTSAPYRKRMAKWFDFDEVRVEWIREFRDE